MITKKIWIVKIFYTNKLNNKKGQDLDTFYKTCILKVD